MESITNQPVISEIDTNEINESIDIDNEGSTNIYHLLIDEYMKCSPATSDYIDSKLYLSMDDNEDLTSEKILYALVQIVLDELKEVGIDFIIDEEDSNQISLLRMIILVRYLVEQNNIKIMLEEHEDEYNEIKNLINTGDQDSIKQYILYIVSNDLLKLLHLKQVYSELDYENLTDKIVNNTRFLEHIEATLDLFVPTSKEVLYTSNEYYVQVVKQVEQDRHDFFYAKTKLKENDIIIRNMTEDYNLDKLGFTYPYWVWCIKDKDLTAYMKVEQKKIIESHKESNKHHIEYYIKRYLTESYVFTHSDLIDLVCHHYHPGMSRNEMRTAMEDMLKIGDWLFTEENKHYMQKIATILMQNHK
jgi:hypothetical protein